MSSLNKTVRRSYKAVFTGCKAVTFALVMFILFAIGNASLDVSTWGEWSSMFGPICMGSVFFGSLFLDYLTPPER